MISNPVISNNSRDSRQRLKVFSAKLPACPTSAFGAPCYFNQLLPLHDEVNSPHQEQWNTVKPVTGVCTRTRDQSSLIWSHPLQDKSPGHSVRASLWNRTKHEKLFGLERKYKESIGGAVKREGEKESACRRVRTDEDESGTVSVGD